MGYREYGITLLAELEEGGEVPLKAAQCWVNGPNEIAMRNLKHKAGGGRRQGSPSLGETWYSFPPREVGDVVRAHERSRSGMHRGAGTNYRVPVIRRRFWYPIG